MDSETGLMDDTALEGVESGAPLCNGVGDIVVKCALEVEEEQPLSMLNVKAITDNN